MKLTVDRITDSPVPHRFTVSPGWFAELMARSAGYPHTLLGEPVFEFEASRMGRDILLQGRFEGAVELECGRCLKRYRQPLQDAWRLMLEPAGERTPPDPESAQMLGRDGLCLADALEVGWYRGNILELDRFFGEIVSLAVPLQPLCVENCAGLCPRCGSDRNLESCDCSDVNTDSPFAALAALKESEGST